MASCSHHYHLHDCLLVQAVLFLFFFLTILIRFKMGGGMYKNDEFFMKRCSNFRKFVMISVFIEVTPVESCHLFTSRHISAQLSVQS